LVKRSPGVNPNPRVGPILDSTVCTRSVASWSVTSTEKVSQSLPGRSFLRWAASPFGVTVSFTCELGATRTPSPALFWIRRGSRRGALSDRRLGLYKICFYFEALVHESIILSLPPPPALPTRLQYYCNTIAQYSSPPPTPICMPYTIRYCALQYRVKANQRCHHMVVSQC